MADATKDNGCMMFIAGSHKQGLREHRPVSEGEYCHGQKDVSIIVTRSPCEDDRWCWSWPGHCMSGASWWLHSSYWPDTSLHWWQHNSPAQESIHHQLQTKRHDHIWEGSWLWSWQKRTGGYQIYQTKINPSIYFSQASSSSEILFSNNLIFLERSASSVSDSDGWDFLSPTFLRGRDNNTSVSPSQSTLDTDLWMGKINR